ncbi:MAG: hypothetical protein ACE5HQ_10320 [Gemmatimonadota bacterium]
MGRFCLWHGDDDEWTPPPEPAELVAARRAFLAELEEAAARLPGDEWILDQRIRYLVEAGRQAEAVRAATDCVLAERSWCRALEGYAWHASGDFVRADSVFSLALAGMPEAERCRWTDLSPVLEGKGSRRYRRLACRRRAAFEERFWRLADPLYIVPGNDRRTEHFARHVLDRAQEDARSGYGVRWGRDLRELLLRYGWPAGWRAVRLGGAGPGSALVIESHDTPGSRRFLPPAEWVGHPERIRPGRWRLKPRRPRSHYAPPYAREIGGIERQIARFRRGDSLVVIAAFDRTRDTFPACDSLVAGLALWPAAAPYPVLDRRVVRGERGVLRVAVAPERSPPAEQAGAGGSRAGGRAASRGAGDADKSAREPMDASGERAVLLSLETLCLAQRMAERERYGLPVPLRRQGERALSDLLVLRRPDPLPASLPEAAEAAAGSLRVHPGQRIGLYWEMYAEAVDAGWASEDVAVTVTLARKGKGLFRRLAEWTRLAPRHAEAVGLRWRERAPAPLAPRSVALDLPDLPAGDYRLEVAVLPPDGQRLVTVRDLEVEN